MPSDPRIPRSILAALLFCTIAAPGAAGARQRNEVTRSFERTVTVSSPATLRVQHRNGNVRIQAGGRNDVRIRAAIRVTARAQADANSFADAIVIDVMAAGNAVAVVTRYPENRRDMRDISYSVDYEIVVPDRIDVDIRNSFGNVAVAGVKSAAMGAIVNAQGNVSLTDAGGTYRVENRFGAIETARITGDLGIVGNNGPVSATTIAGALSITNRFGDVNATTVKGDATINNSNGRVSAAAISGKADLRTSFGAVEVHDVGPLTVTSSNASVNAQRISGPANVKTSFGAVEVRMAAQNVVVENNNGNVTIAAVKGDADSRTTFGATDVTGVSGRLHIVSSNGAITVRDVGGSADLSGRFGRIDTQMIKGGLRVLSSNGDVRAADIDGATYLKSSFGLVQAERVKGGVEIDNSNGAVQAIGVTGATTVNTSFGAVMLRDVEGRIVARNNNGAIEASSMPKPGPCQDVMLTSSFGGITVAVPDVGYTLAARTSFGKITTDLPITTTDTLNGGSIAGSIRGGGCQLQLTNSNGDIRIVRGK